MPGGDRTGPEGAGPRTGRGMGYCSGANAPGWTQGGGRGRGFGRGWGFGGGGRRRHWRAWGPPGWGPPAFAPRWGWYGPAPAPVDEAEMLQAEADQLQSQLDAINQRLDELNPEA